MFNHDSWQSHAEYHINFKNLKAKFPSHLRIFLRNHYAKERQKLISLNLDPVGEYLSRYYSKFGRPAKNQAQILRSFLLFAMLFNRTDAKLSLTAWVEDVLPNDPVLFVLIGCPTWIPCRPSDPISILWTAFGTAPGNIMREPPSFPKGRMGRSQRRNWEPMASWPNRSLINMPQRTWRNPFSMGLRFLTVTRISFRTFFIWLPSCPPSKTGSSQKKTLRTAVAVHANPFGRKPKHPKYPAESISGMRHYSDPDAEWRWDSHEKNWYYGRTLYMLCYRNADLKT